MSQRHELFTYLLEREGFQRNSEAGISRRGNDDIPCRLSFSQERLWFLDQFEHARPVYNGCKVVKFTGELNIRILQDCLDLIAQRHEILRTIYPVNDGVPIQRVLPVCSLEISVMDLKDVAESEVSSAIERLTRDEWLRPINLSQELPIRARLIRIHDALNVLILTLHQIALDSRSVALFFRELWAAYATKLEGKEPELPELPVQYADFAEWQHHRYAGQNFQSQREYWIQRLSGSYPVLNLPTDSPRPPAQSFNGSRLPIQLPEPLQLKLKELSREHGVTPFTTLLAAFNILLCRYTGQTDLLVGCPVLNRGLPETENLLGSFVNTLVLRSNYDGNPSFREALRRVRETSIGAFAHQEFPFEKLVEDLQPQRDLARNPIFQVMFAFQNTPVPALELPGLRSEFIEIDGEMTKFDLTLSLTDKEHGITGHIEYSTDLFSCGTIERMAVHFRTLLEGVVANPDRRIAELPILTAAERHQLLVEWNNTATDCPKDKCIHELFEEQVAKTPDAIAVTFEELQLTYRELNQRANQLGHYLRGLGIGAETLVGICIDRSLEMVVGLLGVLKAGGAYVPLDPAYPKERLRFMTHDAELPVVLTTDRVIDDSGWGIKDGDPRTTILDPRPRVVCLDRDWPVIDRESTENRHGETNSNNLAYVIYTSGSTGQPKGVQVSHRSVVNCLVSVGERVGLTGQDRLLAVTTTSFDIAAVELFLPLLVGGTVILASREEAADGVELAFRVKESSATVMQGTPSTWRMLIEAGWEGSSEFKILSGGEVLSRELAEALLIRGQVWNLYGPTETTIWSTVHKVESGEGPVPIGRPVANTQIYILDTHLQPVPIGVHGELYIGGDGLARGYLNRPELTEERFVPNPFSDQPDSRLYRTGDRARYLVGGDIEFLGRVDNQVKIRGHRIELGEIEAALNQQPGVKDSVVVAVIVIRPSHEEDLVAYFVPKQQPAPSVAELRAYLKAKLPEYMIPSAFMPLDELPLTPNGKVDRTALPASDGGRPLPDHGFVEPRAEIEELVAQIWREVLTLEKIGIHDNFFELGGHSLLATRIAARLRTTFNIDLPLRKVFELPTVAELAGHIEVLRKSENPVCFPPILPVPRDREIPVSFSQQRLWFMRELDPDATAYNMPSIFAIHGPLNVLILERAINAVIARHEILRTVFAEKDGNPIQVILPFLEISIPFIDLRDTPEPSRETKAQELVLAETRRPFDLRAGRLLRATILVLGEQDCYFLLTFDHMILDGTSMAVLFKEIAAYYDAFLDGKPCSLAPLAVQYADYAVWQREGVPDESVRVQQQYWKRQFAAWLAQAELPADHARPPMQTWRGERVTKRLPRELTTGLKGLSRREGVTLFMTLLAAFDIIVSRYTGSEDVVIGSTVAGRNQPETENMIGFFINALPLRVDLSGNPSFMELLKRVREVCLDAYTHQDLPFEKIVEAVNPQRNLNRNPLFQVVFNVADVSARVLALRGCAVSRQPLFDREAKFDLTLYAPEKDGAVELTIVYNADLFNVERLAVMLEQYAVLLGQAVTDPETKIGKYELVTADAKAVLPDPAAPLDNGWIGAIQDLFARNAETVPNRLAINDVLGEWTYGDLERASNRLANDLVANGIKPKDRVAIYAHRGSALVVALMGVLKAGGVFTILDPAYPADRLVSYLRIAQPKAWVQLEGAAKPPSEILQFLDTLGISCRLILPLRKNDIFEALQHNSDTGPAIKCNADDPAYIAFTSGSTGEPKGVLGGHGPITHFLPWQKNAFDLHEDDRFALLSGLAYNHLHRDVFTPLAMGASLFVPPAENVRESQALCRWFRECAITVLHLTPALGELLLTGGEKMLPAVRRIFFGGDVLTRGEVARIRELAPNATIGCFYGATETQRAVGYYEIPEDFSAAGDDGTRAIPLGRGIKDVQLLVLNSAGQMAGVGELGELYMRSPHLAEGYIGDEDLTRERFLINPFTNRPNDRLYRTGELGRYLPDGNVEWAGRNDRCVNIRGFRVELAEIETVLKQHPTVKNAAVVVRELDDPNPDNLKSKIENPKSETRLVAYVAAEEDGPEFIDLLRSLSKRQASGLHGTGAFHDSRGSSV